MVDIICLGEPLIEFSQTRQPGADLYARACGGDTMNSAVAARRQGASVGYLTALGSDNFGQTILDLLTREGIDTRHVTHDDSAQTGIYFISYRDGEHRFDYRRRGSAASRMRPSDLPLEYIQSARFLHVSGISQAIGDSACDTVFAALEAARETGVTTSYDTNLRLKLWSLERARAVIHAGVSMSDIALPGLEDARQLTGLDAPDAIVDHYLGLGPKTVALKMGDQGVIIANGEQRTHIPSHSVTPVDATGAGDTFDGVFLAQLAQGKDIIEAARLANTAAALSTQGHGAIASIPTPDQIQAALTQS